MDDFIYEVKRTLKDYPSTMTKPFLDYYIRIIEGLIEMHPEGETWRKIKKIMKTHPEDIKYLNKHFRNIIDKLDNNDFRFHIYRALPTKDYPTFPKKRAVFDKIHDNMKLMYNLFIASGLCDAYSDFNRKNGRPKQSLKVHSAASIAFCMQKYLDVKPSTTEGGLFEYLYITACEAANLKCGDVRRILSKAIKEVDSGYITETGRLVKT